LASESALPDLVRRQLERSVPAGQAPAQVRIAQTGDMWQKAGSRALRFTATQRFAVDRVAFSWRARFPIAGPIGIDVVDDFADGEGALRARVLGIPVQRQSGQETVAGEVLRYLAELPWVPYAAAHNAELEWREIDRRTVEVATDLRGERLAVTVDFDDAGDVVHSSSQQRLLRVGKTWTATPWGGVFDTYATLGGLRVPTRAHAYWDLPEGRFVYWRGRVTSAEGLREAFAR
jgi:hypothetical protein